MTKLDEQRVAWRLREFRLARERLRIDFSGRGEAKFLEAVISAPTITRLKKSEEEFPSHKFDPSVQERLIHGLLEHERSASLYDQLAHLMEQPEGARDDLLRDYLGEFRYFRFACKGAIDDIYYVSGRIRIFKDPEGNPSFEHWSHDYASEDPEHTGLVFHYENRIYMLGTARGMMRLAIGRTLTAPKSRGYIAGLVVSVRDDPHRDPYSARFIMVHEANKLLIQRLSDESSSSEQNTVGGFKTNGEVAFGEVSRADYAWYLLTH